MPTRRERAELEVAEYLLGLDALGLGGKGERIYARAMVRDVRPLLHKQKALLERSLATEADLDAEVLALDERIAVALEGLLDSLKVLWLTEGQQEAAQ